MQIVDLFRDVFVEIQEQYSTYRFYTERDLVWTVQRLLTEKIEQMGLEYLVFNDYPIERGSRRSKSVDIAVVHKDIDYHDVLNAESEVELVIEFKYEPSSKRVDICKQKLPVVSWRNVIEDVERVRRFVEHGKAKVGVSILIDEDGRHYKLRGAENQCSSTWHIYGDYNSGILNVHTFISEFQFRDL